MSEDQQAAKTITMIGPDMRGHPSQAAMDRDAISAFKSATGLDPEISYGTRNGLYGMILEAKINPPN